MARTSPVKQVCPLCAHDDPEYLTWSTEGPGQWRYVCTDPSHPDPFEWFTTGIDVLDVAAGEGLSIELGIYQDLLDCFQMDEPMLEYGVVEYRYAVSNPVEYRRLVAMYSHTRRGETKYSASAFIGGALGKLCREGLLRRVDVKATGYWHYNGTLTAMGLVGGANDEILTWETYAQQISLDPEDWPIELLGSP